MLKSFWVALIATLALLTGGIASASAATLFVSPGASGTACTQAAPCPTPASAYAKASPGDVIEVASGSYGNVSLADRPTLSATGAAQVVIRPASGANVTANDLLVFASNLRVVGFSIPCCYGQPDVRAPAHDVVIEDAKATNFYVTGSTRNVTIKGGEYGPYVSTGGGSHIKSASAGGDGTDFPVDTVVDGVYFHDYSVPSGSSAHLDCLHVFYHQRVTVKNSRFERCQHYGILLGSNGAGRVDGDVITNNYFGDAEVAGFALRGGPGEDFNDVLVQNNTGGTVTPQTTNTLTNVRWYDNVVDSVGSCRSGIDYQRNTITSGSLCGATDKRPGTSPPADTTAPNTTITNGPTDSESTDATVAFTSSEAGSTFECRLDADAWAGCVSPKAYSGLAVGTHTVAVRAIDTAGNIDGSPATVTWSVLAPPPPDECNQTQQQLEAAQAQIVVLQGQVTTLTTQRDAANARADAEKARADAAQAKLDDVRAVLDR